jgi:hypothetical protein
MTCGHPPTHSSRERMQDGHPQGTHSPSSLQISICSHLIFSQNEQMPEHSDIPLTYIRISSSQQAPVARGIHGLPKVSPGPPMPYSFFLWASHPRSGLQPFWGWPAWRAGSLQPSSTPLDTPRCAGLALNQSSLRSGGLRIVSALDRQYFFISFNRFNVNQNDMIGKRIK